MKKFLRKFLLALNAATTLNIPEENPLRKGWVESNRLDPERTKESDGGFILGVFCITVLFTLYACVKEWETVSFAGASACLLLGLFFLFNMWMESRLHCVYQIGDDRYTFASAVKAVLEATTLWPNDASQMAFGRSTLRYKFSGSDYEHVVSDLDRRLRREAESCLEKVARDVVIFQEGGAADSTIAARRNDFVHLWGLLRAFGLVEDAGYGPYFEKAQQKLRREREAVAS
jgi:hypothetical protein